MILAKFAHMKALFLDVDGVLTDGTVLVTENGEQLRRFSIKDGYALQHAVKQGLIVAVISGGRSQGVLTRLQGLGVEEVHLGVTDKQSVMEEILKRFNVSADEAVFIGDDLPDLQCMQQVAVAACPTDAAEEVKAISSYISPKKGGEGCVRDVIEKILKLQDKWGNDGSIRSI